MLKITMSMRLSAIAVIALLFVAIMIPVPEKVFADILRCSPIIDLDAEKLPLYQEPEGRQIGFLDMTQTDLDFEVVLHHPLAGKEATVLTEIMMVTVIHNKRGKKLGYLSVKDAKAAC